MKKAIVAVAVCVALGASGRVRAQQTESVPGQAAERDDATALPVPGEAEARDPPIAERRPLRDYDARADAEPGAGEALLWIPRVLLFPITFVLDYVIRHPLGLLATEIEEHGWDEALIDFLTWNEGRSGIFPTFWLAYATQPTVGFVLFSNDDLAPGHAIDVSASFGGVDTTAASGTYAIALGPGARVELGGGASRRPDRVFSGTGWDSIAVRYRYREAAYDADLRLVADALWRQSMVAASFGIDGHELDPDGYAGLSDDPSVAEGIAAGAIQSPTGMGSGYRVQRSRVDVALDSREPEPAPGHGVRVGGYAELAVDLDDPRARRWARWGGGVGAFLDLGDRRVLGLWSLVGFSDPLGRDEQPFTELVALGQDALLMRGFLRGELRGRSAVATTLEYVYPIWTWLDGRAHVSIGNVFDAHLQDFAMERLRLAFGIGVSTAGDPDHAAQVSIAFGTGPFTRGASVDSVQFIFGTRDGF